MSKRKYRAYAVLAGGGIKATALAGCLSAATEKYDMEFLGYGGTSAGSMIALLASIGYTGNQFKHVITEKASLANFLGDEGKALRRLVSFLRGLDAIGSNGTWSKRVKLARKILTARGDFLGRLLARNGLYQGDKAILVLHDLVREQLYQLRDRPITFQALRDLGGQPLKIVSTDIRTRQPYIFPRDDPAGLNASAIHAVRASIGYPFVFEPYSYGGHSLVDGGVTSNLPVFLFEDERRATRAPVIAFDVTTPPAETRPGFFGYMTDLISTAVESSEHIIQDSLYGIEYLPVVLPTTVTTFGGARNQMTPHQLYDLGVSAADSFFPGFIRQQELLELNQSRLHEWISPILHALVAEIGAATPQAADLRAYILLPTDDSTYRALYRYNMDGDADADMEVAVSAGCAGLARARHDVAFVDLEESSLLEQGYTPEQKSLIESVKPVRRSVMAAPLFNFARAPLEARRAARREELTPVGSLVVDSSTPLRDTLWLQKRALIRGAAQRWADVVATVVAQEGLSNVRP